MKKNKKRVGITALLLVTGSFLIACPFLCNFWYEHSQEQQLLVYRKEMQERKEELSGQETEAAREYNQKLAKETDYLKDPFSFREPEEDTLYDSLLNPFGDGIMGYLSIPSLDLILPVFHGTGEKSLERGAGHLQGTSLPVGGESTHCVLAAHNGTSKNRLFGDLHLLQEKDFFLLYVEDEEYVYQVDRILTVEPSQTEYFSIVSGEDRVTLVTCTPLGVNSHRLLVQGVRVSEMAEDKAAKRPGSWMKKYGNVMAAILGILLLAAFLAGRIRRKDGTWQ